MSATKVIIVEDEPLFRQMLHSQLDSDTDVQVVGEAATGEEAIQLADDLHPEVMLMDIELGEGMTGIEAGYTIKKKYPATGIVLLSNHKAKQFIVASGGWSYLIKRNVRDIESLVRAIRGAAWGMLVVDPTVTEALQPKADTPLSNLSPEHLKVLELIAQGYSDAAVAKELVIEEVQVHGDLTKIVKSLGLQLDDEVDIRVSVVRVYLEQTGAFKSASVESEPGLPKTRPA